MTATKRTVLATVSLGALLALGAAMSDARAQATHAQTAHPAAPASAAAKAEDSGTMQRADKEMRRVLEELQQLGAKPIGTQSVEQTREGPTPADAVKAVLRERGKDPAALMAQMGVKAQDMAYPTEGGTQKVRIYTPPVQGQQPLPVIVYYHGGGWVIADIGTYEASAMALAKKTGAIVASVEYRHAPEHRFPAAHEDAFAAYRWVAQNAASFGGDPKRLAVAGESAGGNLAVNTAIAARDGGVQAPLHMLLVYPVAGTDLNTPSYRTNEDAIPLSKRAMEWFVQNTASKPEDLRDPRLDLVGRANLAGLPPATVIGAEIDPLLSEGKALADKLKRAGVRTSYQEYKGVTHEFFGMDAVVPDAGKAQSLAAKGLRDALAIRATGQANTGSGRRG